MQTTVSGEALSPAHEVPAINSFCTDTISKYKKEEHLKKDVL